MSPRDISPFARMFPCSSPRVHETSEGKLSGIIFTITSENPGEHVAKIFIENRMMRIKSRYFLTAWLLVKIKVNGNWF